MSAKNSLLLLAATVPASSALVRDGYFSSSDGMIHLYRVFELDRAIRAGIFFPRWFPLSGYGYGLPVLNYYPPLAYYIAEVFNLLGMGYIGSIKTLVAFSFIVGALSMFFFARDLLGTVPALVAAIAFTYLPYLMSDAYIRGNFPEMLAMSLIPLVLFAFRRGFNSDWKSATSGQKTATGFMRGMQSESIGWYAFAALSFAAIILTHHLTALLTAPLIAAYICLLFAMQHDWRKLLACTGAISISLVLSAFYWAPAITELNLVFVGPASLARFLVSRLVTFEQFFAPSLAYTYVPQSDALQHSAGFPQTVAALVIAITAAVSMRGAKREGNPIVSTSSFPSPISHVTFFLVVLLLSIFMMLTFAAPLWYAIPTLRFMQFPWRFQIASGISIAFLIGVGSLQLTRITNYLLRSFSQFSLSFFLIFLALFNLPDRSVQLTDSQVNLLRSDDPDYVVAQMGWSWTREFVPVAVQDENVVGWKQRELALQTMQSMPEVRIEREGFLSRTMRVISPEPTEISLHQFFFPGWQANVDGAVAPTYPSGSLGLVTVRAPQGDHRVEFRFEETPNRSAIDVISALAFLGMGVWLFIARRRAFIVLTVAVISLGVIVAWRTRIASTVEASAISADLGHNAALIGYSTERAGDALYITLEWFALHEMDRDYVAFVHLVDASGALVAQSDALTDWGVTPTSRWQRGEMVTDRRMLRKVPNGSYQMFVGMYQARDGGIENLVAYDREGKALGNQIELGLIQLGK